LKNANKNMKYQIPSTKTQINSKHQAPNSKCLEFGIWILFGICILSFGILSAPRPAHAGLILKLPSSLGLTTGLVGYWTFDGNDISGTNAIDRSPAGGNNGSVSGDPVRTAGKIGQGLNFDGVDDQIWSGLVFSGNFSYGLWVKTTKTAEQYFLHGTQDLTPRYQIGMNGNGPVYGATMEIGGSYTTETSAGINDGQWHQLVFTGDGTNVVTYLDGVQNKTDILANPLGSNNFYIGGVGSTRFMGTIDDVRIYNRALSAEEILRLYNMGH
jgi:hypothetical protein